MATECIHTNEKAYALKVCHSCYKNQFSLKNHNKKLNERKFNFIDKYIDRSLQKSEILSLALNEEKFYNMRRNKPGRATSPFAKVNKILFNKLVEKQDQ